MPASMVSAARKIVGSRWFDPLMLGVIVVNAIVLGAETFPSVKEQYGDQLDLANEIMLGLFLIELGIRITSYGRRPQDFFKSGWNVFDFVVITASLAPGLRQNATLLRLLRLLRIVRAVRLLPDLRVLTVAVGRSIPGVASLAVLTLLLIYVYGMVGWAIFHDFDPANFANIGQSMITMFVLLTLENLPVYIEKGQELSDWTIVFFVSYVLVAAFLVFNLFIGIVINSMEEARAIELRRAEQEMLDDDPSNDLAAQELIVEERLHALRTAVEELERELAAARRARAG
jgi:voltage-gated sodium channel